MKLTVKVEVTQRDSENGVPGHPWYCPTARALSRALGDIGLVFKYAGVGYNVIKILRPASPELNGRLPGFMVEWVRDFDERQSGAPINFEVELEVTA